MSSKDGLNMVKPIYGGHPLGLHQLLISSAINCLDLVTHGFVSACVDTPLSIIYFLQACLALYKHVQ